MTSSPETFDLSKEKKLPSTRKTPFNHKGITLPAWTDYSIQIKMPKCQIQVDYLCYCEECGSRRTNEAEASPSGAQAKQPPSQHGDLEEDRQRDNYQENINVMRFFMLKKKKRQKTYANDRNLLTSITKVHQ